MLFTCTEWIVHIMFASIMFCLLHYRRNQKHSASLSLSLPLCVCTPVYSGIFATTWNYWKLTHAFVWEFQNWGNVCRRLVHCATHNRCVLIDCISMCICAPLNFHHTLTVGLATLQIVCKYDSPFQTDPNHNRLALFRFRQVVPLFF